MNILILEIVPTVHGVCHKGAGTQTPSIIYTMGDISCIICFSRVGLYGLCRLLKFIELCPSYKRRFIVGTADDPQFVLLLVVLLIRFIFVYLSAKRGIIARDFILGETSLGGTLKSELFANEGTIGKGKDKCTDADPTSELDDADTLTLADSARE